MTKKILVVGAMYSPNLGDGVICQTVGEIVKKVLNAEPVIFGISGSSTFQQKRQGQSKHFSVSSIIRNLYFVKKTRGVRVKHKLWKKLDSLADNCDAIVFAGGQLFMDCFVNYIVWIVDWANKHNTQVLFNCCGVGKLSENNRKALEAVFNSKCVSDISIRESSELFYSYFSKQLSVERIYDPAMEVADYHPLRAASKCRIGIGVIHPVNFRENCVGINEEQYLKIMKILIEWCQKNDVAFEFFTNGDPLDAQFCNELVETLGCRDKLAPVPNSPDELINTVTRYEHIISFRLHSHIIATSYGIPTVAFIWDEKVKEFMKLICREHRCISLEKMPSIDDISYNLYQLMNDDTVTQDFAIESTSHRMMNLLGDKN